MSYTFEIKDLPLTPVLYLCGTCNKDAIGPTLAKLLPAVGKHMRELGLQQAGAPFARYTDWRETDCDLDGGIPVSAPASATGDIKAGELGGRTLTTTHVGPYADLTKAHEAVHKWMAEHNLQMSGAPYKSYITDPGAEPDPGKWQTLVCYPVL